MLERLQELIYVLPAVILALTVHEFSHAFVAMKCGDETAREQGRVSLNPLRHIDWVGLLMLIILRFGWAKPVMIDKRNFKSPIRDEILVALAGPFSNLIIGSLVCLLIKGVVILGLPLPNPVYVHLFIFLEIFIKINWGLAIFNMIPLPPLDGSHLVTAFLSEESSSWLVPFRRIGPLLLLGLILVDNWTPLELLPIGRIVDLMLNLVYRLLGL
jgi:Zn-dependent protease